MVPDAELYALLGANVRKYREIARLTQDEVADRLSLSRTSVTNIEKGKQRIQIHTLYNIAKVLGVSVTDLLPPADEDSTRREQFDRILGMHSQEVRNWVLEVLTPQLDG